MAVIPTLPDLVGEVLLAGLAGPRDPIQQIAQAERLAGELTHLGESLVGFFVEQARADGLSWADIGAPRGLSRQGAQQRYAPLLAQLSIADLVEAGALRQFGEAALAALRRAEEHASRLGHEAIDSGDLLLGVLDDNGSPAVAALRELGVDPVALRSQLQQFEEGTTWHGAQSGSDVADDDGGASRPCVTGQRGVRRESARANMLPLDAEARRAIDGAAAEARGHLVGSPHLLLGILRNPAGRAGRVLGERGITKSSAMAAVLAVASRQSSDRK
jgi:hypothetical protein